MRFVVKGREIRHVWSVDDGMQDGEFQRKPQLKCTDETKVGEEILRFKGELRYNSSGSMLCCKDRINISENEEVFIIKEVFRADLNETHLLTNKTTSEYDVNKDETVEFYEAKIREFNRRMIESNEKLKAYCDIHKLDYEDTDCLELWKIVWPDHKWMFCRGKLVPVAMYDMYDMYESVTCSSSLAYSKVSVDAIELKADVATSSSTTARLTING